MGGSGDAGRQPSGSPAFSRFDARHRELLERAEAQFRRSALLLRANGKSDNARRAEEFADWASVHVHEPEAAQAVYGLLTNSLPVETVAAGVLEFALELLRADRGNVQLADPVTGALRIAAHCGFGTEFLDYFAVVTDGGSACGRAAQQCAQVVIADVSTDPGFTAHRDIAAASGFRAVQSTPLISSDGRVVGMVSTHYQSPVELQERDLMIIRRFGTLIGQRLGKLPATSQPPARI